MCSRPPEPPAIPPEAEIRASDVIERIMKISGTKTDAELARVLGVSKTTISSWRQRNATPFEACVRMALRYNCSLDLIILGIDHGHKSSTSSISLRDENKRQNEIDVDILQIAHYDMETTQAYDRERLCWIKSEKWGRWLAMRYKYYASMAEALYGTGMPREQALDTLRTSVINFGSETLKGARAYRRGIARLNKTRMQQPPRERPQDPQKDPQSDPQ